MRHQQLILSQGRQGEQCLIWALLGVGHELRCRLSQERGFTYILITLPNFCDAIEVESESADPLPQKESRPGYMYFGS